MAYAAFPDVEARAGRFAGVFTIAGKHPDQSDIEAYLDELSAQVDAAIEARGYDPALIDQRAQDALRDLVAYGALARGLRGVSGDRELDQLRDYAQKVWGQAMGDPASNTTAGQQGSIAAGSHPVIVNLEAGAGGVAGTSAGSYWDDRPAPTEDVELAPTFTRAQKT